MSGAESLNLPPLLTDIAVTGDVDPFLAAEAAARDGIDAGAVFWALREDRMEAALVLAPEQPLRDALPVLFAGQQALTDAIGALGPAEIAAHWAWPDVFLLNGAAAGRLRVSTDTDNLDATPRWLILALSLRRLPPEDIEPGERPDETSLAAEGLGDLAIRDLVSAWARHALYWITTHQNEGLAPLMREWRGRAHGADGEVELTLGPEAPLIGAWLGVDEEGGLIIKTEQRTVRLGLERVLSAPFQDRGADALRRRAGLTRLSGSAPIGGEALRKR
ncbi:MAG: biotin/lipoate--protein ligase family protein [Neomegalonema sp.]|nr:biotin/lipoate--protein ligase family protein [Neomegalonema sp.]